MRTPSSSPWIIRCSVHLYRWLLCLGSHTYRRQYADRTLQLFRECCQDAYRQRGIPGVLGLWFPLFSDVVTQMLAEQLSELQHASELKVSVEIVSPSAKDRTPTINSVWQQINHQWIIMGPRTTHESGVVASGLQGKSSAFLRSTKASAQVVATLRQTIKADDYRGKQLRFSGDIKVEQVEQQAGLYIRTNRRDERLRPENVVQGTHDWMRYEATVPVAEDAPFIRFGLVLHGKGQIWLANAQLEVIEQG